MFKPRWFKEQNLYALDGKIKPFSKAANGLVLGDGAAAIILEEFNHAKKRKAHIYAEYLGGGFSLEGWKVILPEMNNTSYQNTIKTALINSCLEPKDIDLINPHGVGIKITDKYEAEAITKIFGKNQKKPAVSAFKPYIGHNLGGSALIELIILLLGMENNLIPATLNSDLMEEKYSLNLIRKNTNYKTIIALKLSCGFAGYNGAVIFKKYVQ
jgi:3-oxoacyl-[acyl-carrier-protein] synthase II